MGNSKSQGKVMINSKESTAYSSDECLQMLLTGYFRGIEQSKLVMPTDIISICKTYLSYLAALKPSPFTLNPLQILLFGPGLVGKTAIVHRIMFDEFPEESWATLEEYHNKHLMVLGEKNQLRILDTGGVDEYSAMRLDWIKRAEAIILVYDVTKKASLEVVQDELYEYAKYAEKTMVLCGNKCVSKDRQILTEEGQQLAPRCIPI